MNGRRLRVTYVIDKMQRAGAQVHLSRLVSGLDRQAFDPEIVCLLEGGPLADEVREAGVPVHVLGLGKLYAPQALVAARRLARHLRARPADVLHTYLVSANVYAGLVGRLAGVPLVTSRRDAGFSRNGRMRFIEERFVNPGVRKVVAVSAGIAAETRLERGLHPEQVVAIENGVDLAEWDMERVGRGARTELGFEPGHLVVGTVGHLSPQKGHADFLEAARRIADQRPEARFVLVGDGPLRPALQTLAAGLGLADRVTFTGTRADVARLLAAFDVAVLPSHTEGMSNALLEAMAMRRPVVATGVGGTPDVVQDGATGKLVPARSPAALADAVLGLAGDPDAARRMGAAGHAWVAEHLSLERMVRRYEDLYRSVVHS